jgi:acyl carrier protein
VTTRDRIKKVIVERLGLEIAPDSIADDSLLFAPAVANGLELESLAALEIIVGLSAEFDLYLDEVPREAFMSVDSLADFVDARLGAPSGLPAPEREPVE